MAGTEVGSQPIPTRQRQIYDLYREHTSAQLVQSNAVFLTALREKYPDHYVTTCSSDLVKYAEAGHATAKLVHDSPILHSWSYRLPDRRVLGKDALGTVRGNVIFGRYDYDWQGHHFEVYVVSVDNCGNPMQQTYVLCKPEEGEPAGGPISKSIEALVLAVGTWENKSDKAVWVFKNGNWYTDTDLWRSVEDSKYEDIILEEKTKSDITRDVEGFFDAKDQYAEFGAPWKRGLIFHGTPGNGKTMTLKVLMKTLMARPEPIPTLFVKSLAQMSGIEQMSIEAIFSMARQTAPCMLLLEDIDSLISDEVRSDFLNELDGLEDNNGILVIGTTNHLDKLDPGLSKRPSRFDRKYRFNTPAFEQRQRYCQVWNDKLLPKPSVDVSAAVPEQVASVTDGFSFAYLKELYLSTLLSLYRKSSGRATLDEYEHEDNDEDDQKFGQFGNLLRKQAATLRSEMAEA
ncbi:MAG: hypothetical protein M1819_001345 [Sarea resinae]|nr:MAG: hypothetical protein M1819_001345 [Sarea resinae]